MKSLLQVSLAKWLDASTFWQDFFNDSSQQSLELFLSTSLMQALFQNLHYSVCNTFNHISVTSTVLYSHISQFYSFYFNLFLFIALQYHHSPRQPAISEAILGKPSFNKTFLCYWTHIIKWNPVKIPKYIQNKKWVN